MDKLSPGIQVCLDDYAREGRVGLHRSVGLIGINLNLQKASPPKIVLFIHCEPNTDLRYLAEFGIEINQRRGSIRTGYAPVDTLGILSEAPGVIRVVSSRILRPLLDAALRKSKIPEFRNNSGLSGKGTIIGIIDTGIDSSHPAFDNRVIRIWDQELSGPGVPEGRYGKELKHSELGLSADTDGHGTHVAGIAAGSDPKFGGVAPQAELVIVKTDYQTAHIADGVSYVFSIAKQMGRPAVVNLSLGDHFDAHDGTDSLSRFIDKQTGAGRLVCCAAGNESLDNIHAQAVLDAGESKTLRFRVPANKVKKCILNAWYPGTSSLEISITSPAGESTPFQGVIGHGNSLIRTNCKTLWCALSRRAQIPSIMIITSRFKLMESKIL